MTAVGGRAVSAALVTATIAGCGLGATTVHHSGVIGQTLSGPGGLHVTPTRYRPSVRSRPGVTGLATPLAGTHFASFLIQICINTTDLPTIAQQNFGLELSGGDHATLKFPETLFSDDLDLLGEAGCEQGHILFQVPSGHVPAKLTFKLDISRPDPNNGGGAFNKHVRLDWAL